MKRLFLMFFIAVALAACGDGGANGTDTTDTTDMDQPAPGTDTMRTDTTMMDTARDMDQ